jgi:hypothetical protein
MMDTLTRYRQPLTVSLACFTTRLLTWGLEPELRTELVIEGTNDWELMYRDYGPRRVVSRALRGIPSAVLTRMDDNNMTALPAALVLTIMAVAAAGAGLLAHTYPADVRHPILISALGLGLGGITLVHSPRRIVLSKLRLAALVLAIGTVGVAFNMPTEADWQYDIPMVDTPFADFLMVVGFLAIAGGCGLIILASVRRTGRRRLAGLGGSAALAGILSFGIGQIIWGFAAVPVDLAITACALGVGLGSCSLAHVLPRLRHLDVV